MLKLSYLAMLVFTIVGSFWLELALKVGVLRRIKRALLAIIPIAALFIIWDGYAISRHHWSFDPRQIVGIFGPLDIPLEEFLFFLIIPLAALMTYEAVSKVKPAWRNKNGAKK